MLVCLCRVVDDDAEAGARGDPSASLNGAVGVRERRALFRKKIMFRLLAACPPLVGALFVSNLGKILDYSGVSLLLQRR